MQVEGSNTQISKDLYGLVVCGGQSSRMGTDKSLLVYYDQPQRYHVFEILKPLCGKVSLSCNRTQASDIPAEYDTLTDLEEYEQIGPMAAVLTAFSKFPDKDLLVTGVDYPLLTTEIIRSFLKNLKRESIAAAFYNDNNKYEPLLAWYSRDCAPLLKAFFDRNEFSLQHFLRSVNAQKYRPEDHNVMTSVDTPDEYQNMKLVLNHQNIKLK